MSMLKDSDKKKLAKAFEELDQDVTIVMFTQEIECEYCQVTREVLEEVASLSPKITLVLKDFVKDADEAASYGVDKIPATILLGDKDYGIRFFGVPAGYEFTSLIEDILDVSHRDPHISQAVLDELAKVDAPVHLQAMVTPTCPFCPRAVRVAHRFAMASDHIRADMVEISEYPFLAVKYDVQGVPNTIINEEHSALGALPDKELAQALLEALGK